MNINVRFLNDAGVDLPGAGFTYACQPGADLYQESASAISRARQKAATAGRRITEIVTHPDEIKIWVA